MSQRLTHKNLPALLPTPALTRPEAIKLSQEHLQASIPNQQQATGELLSLKQLGSALETGRDRELGWSENLTLAAIADLVHKNSATVEACLPAESAKNKNLIPKVSYTQSSQEASWLGRQPAEILNDSDFKRHFEKQEVQLELAQKQSLITRMLQKFDLPDLRLLASKLIRILPDRIRKEIEDKTPTTSVIDWSATESEIAPNRERYVAEIKNPSQEFLDRAAVLSCTVFSSQHAKKIELFTYLKAIKEWDLERALWHCKKLSNTAVQDPIAEVVFPLDRGYQSFPLAAGFDLGSAQYLDARGQGLNLEVKVAISLVGGFKVVNIPPNAKALRFEVQKAQPDYPKNRLAELFPQLKKVLPISEVSVGENKFLLNELNKVDLSAKQKADVWQHRMTEQDYRYVASSELNKLYQRAGNKAFALMQGLRMATCDSIAALEYQQLNAIDGLLALQASVMAFHGENKFIESPGHAINRVYSAEGHYDMDFTDVMKRTQGKFDKLKRVVVSEDLSPEQVCLVGQELRRALLGFDKNIPAVEFVMPDLRKVPGLTAEIKFVGTPTLSLDLYTESIYELLRARILIGLVDQLLNQPEPSLIKIFRQIHDLSSDQISPPDIRKFFPQIAAENFEELHKKLHKFLLSAAQKAVSDKDHNTVIAILDWCICQMVVLERPEATGIKSFFNFNPNFKISAQEFGQIFVLFAGYNTFKSDQLTTIANQYIKQFRSLTNQEITFETLEPLMLMIDKFASSKNFLKVVELYAVVCERLGQFDLINDPNNLAVALLRQGLLSVNIQLTKINSDKVASYLITVASKLNPAAISRAIVFYNRGSNLGFDEILKSSLGRRLPIKALQSFRQSKSIKSLLLDIEIAVELGLPDDLSEVQTSYLKLAEHLQASVFRSPINPGPALSLLSYLSIIGRAGRLVQELEQRSAFGDLKLSEQLRAQLSEQLSLQLILGSGLKIIFDPKNSQKYACQFTNLSAQVYFPIASLSYLVDPCLVPLHRFQMDKLRELEDSNPALPLEESNSQPGPSELFFNFIDRYSVLWKREFEQLKGAQAEIAVEVIRPTQKYSELKEGLLKVKSTLDQEYTLSLLRNSGISPQHLYLAMLKVSAQWTKLIPSDPAETLAVAVFAALHNCEERWLGDTVAEFCSVMPEFVFEIIPEPSGTIVQNSEEKLKKNNQLLANWPAILVEARMPKALNRIMQRAQLAQSYLHRYPAQTVKYFCHPGDFGVKFKANSGEFYQQVNYSAGDDLRAIDWKAFARTDQLYSRVSRNIGISSVQILVDLHYLAEHVSSLCSAIELGSESLEHHYGARIFQLFSLITNIQAENRGLPIKISLCDAFGSIQSFRYNSEKREFQQELSKALVTVGGQSFLRTASCQQLLDRDSVDTKNINNTAYFVFAAPETVERQAKQIDFLRKKSGAVNVVLDQSAQIVHF